MTRRTASNYFLFFVLIWILPNMLIAQVDQTEFNIYLKEMNVGKLNERNYVIIHSMNNCPYFDREWVSRFVNVEQEFEKILFVVIIEDSKQLNLLSSYALKRENLVVDSSYTYQNQSFYNYYPSIYSIKSGEIILEKKITYYTSYRWWTHLYRKHMK